MGYFIPLGKSKILNSRAGWSPVGTFYFSLLIFLNDGLVVKKWFVAF